MGLNSNVLVQDWHKSRLWLLRVILGTLSACLCGRDLLSTEQWDRCYVAAAEAKGAAAQHAQACHTNPPDGAFLKSPSPCLTDSQVGRHHSIPTSSEVSPQGELSGPLQP